MTAYYNEFDPFAAAWLRELMADGLIAPGDVDERSITDIQPTDLVGYHQCHFFAGIGGWSYALRLAGWPDERPVWTGSCPCQPFSSAGRRQGGTDDRHLWPHWARLIRECRPVAVFGEQVESAIAHGWLDAVFDDLEREGYACGAACLPAASVGAFHLRQRLWFVADSEGGRLGEHRSAPRHAGYPDECVTAGELAESNYAERRPERVDREDGRDGDDAGRQETHGEFGACGQVRHMADDDRERRDGKPIRLREWGPQPTGAEVSRRGTDDAVGDSGRGRLEAGHEGQWAISKFDSPSPWSGAIWLPCRDGKARPVKPSIFPLAHGIPNRVGTLRGAGNAIVPQVAAEVIRTYLEVTA